jgi:hypothetical protein
MLACLLLFLLHAVAVVSADPAVQVDEQGRLHLHNPTGEISFVGSAGEPQPERSPHNAADAAAGR